MINKNSRHIWAAIIHFSLAIFFSHAFYDRFWIWRDKIAEVKTSFITPDGNNVTSSGMLWIFPATIFAILGIIRIVKYLKKRN